ncbi:MAG: diguanylate cyclase, partial [Planctomycetales bacterium]|nr:diguanylate cyclase [Planctomycetales bacterium]
VAECGPAAERARAAIEAAKFVHEGVELRVTASFGLAELKAGEKITETVKRADDALYASKKAGRNNCHWNNGAENRPFASAVKSTPAPKLESAPPKPAAAAVAKPADDPQPAKPAPQKRPTPTIDLGVDEVTRLSNRRSFAEDVQRRAAESKRTNAPLSMLLVGIDDYSGLGQLYGEAASESILKAVTKFLKAVLRDMDHVARYDDDVFGLLLPGANLGSAEVIAERLRQAIAKCSLRYEDMQLRFSVCVGVADARHGDDGQRLVERTEEALAAARSDMNRTFVHDGRQVRELVKEGAAAQ